MWCCGRALLVRDWSGFAPRCLLGSAASMPNCLSRLKSPPPIELADVPS